MTHGYALYNDTGDVIDESGNLVSSTVVKSFNFSSPGGSSGTFYLGGYYDAPATDVTLTQASPTQTYGTANVSYAAHAFLVASGAGTTDGSDLVITVSGTSITDAGVRTPADSEILVADCTAASTDQYFETTKNWLGQITYTLSSTGGSTFSFTFNYGFVKSDELGDRDFTIIGIEGIGRAGANDNGFNIGILHHKDTGWTYSAAAFSPGTGYLSDMNTIHGTESEITNGKEFAWRVTGLNQAVSGSTIEGFILTVVTGSNNAVESLDIHVTCQLT